MAQKPFRVLIAGGSIAGLTLALLLEKAGIDYVILEAHGEIAPQVGASIGWLPNGSRVMDQLGIYDQMWALLGEPFLRSRFRCATTRREIQAMENIGDQERNRYGYNFIFVDRQMVLEVFWRNLQHKDRVHLNKRVAEVKLHPNSVEVKTTDGATFSGDILVGADGVHSKVRSELWRISEALEPGYISAAERAGCLPTESKCIFGISIVEDFEKATATTVFGKRFSYLVIAGPRHRVYWFLFQKIDKKHYGTDLPRYTKQDEEALVKDHWNDQLTDKHVFGDLYKAKISSTLTPIPEYIFKKWYFDRIITIGDAAHKVDPISGHGGNSAIETAGVLVSNLVRLLEQSPAGLTKAQIHEVFSRTQSQRQPRVQELMCESHARQSLASMEGRFAEHITPRLVPIAGMEQLLDAPATCFAGAHRADFLPMPKREYYIPFVDELPSRPLGSRFSALVTSGVVLLFAALFYAALTPEAFSWGAEHFERAFKILIQGPGERSSFTPQVPFETASETPRRYDTPEVFFLANMVPIVYIFLVEAYRNGNKLGIATSIVTLTVNQFLGLGAAGPLYFLLSLYATKKTVYTRTTGRFVDPAVANALFPGLCLAYALSVTLAYVPNGAAQQAAVIAWRWCPVLVMVLLAFVPRSVPVTSSIGGAGWTISTEDFMPLLCGYLATSALTLVSNLAYRLLPGQESQLAGVFEKLPHVLLAANRVSPSEFQIFWAAVAVWSLYSVFELRRLGYVTTRSALQAAGAVGLGQALVGPGPVFAALWAWRESVIVGLSQAR